MDVSNALVSLLYRDPAGLTWLVLIVDGVGDDSGGAAAIDLANLGGAGLELVDDPGEGEQVLDGIELAFQWAGCCTDGAIVGPLDDDFCVEMTILEGASGLGEGYITFSGEEPIDLGGAEGRVELCVVD